jgi:hypothetical protein
VMVEYTPKQARTAKTKRNTRDRDLNISRRRPAQRGGWVARHVLFEVDGPHGFEFEFYNGPKTSLPTAPFPDIRFPSTILSIYLHASYQQHHYLPAHSQPGQRCTITVLRCEPKFLVPCERHPVSLPGLHAFHSPTDIFDFLCRIMPKSFSAIPQVSHVFVRWGWRSVRAAKDRHRNRPVCCRSVLQRVAKVGLRLVYPASKSPDCAVTACQQDAVMMHCSTCTYRFRTNQSDWSYRSPRVAPALVQI